MVNTVEQNKLTESERLISAEEWEAYEELVQECLRHDLPITFSFDTNRYSEGNSDEVIQGRQGFRLEIGDSSFKEGDGQKVYRNLRDLVADGWRILEIIATEEHIEDIEISNQS